jgi:hypothetical protein
VGRIAGRNAVIYFGTTSGAQASPLAFSAKYSLNFSFTKIDVTAFGDRGQVNLAGLAAQSGDMSGWYDDATAQTYTAAVDGLARKLYIYPNASTATQYFFGSVVADFNSDSTVDGAATFSSAFQAATADGIQKVG